MSFIESMTTDGLSGFGHPGCTVAARRIPKPAKYLSRNSLTILHLNPCRSNPTMPDNSKLKEKGGHK